MGNLTTPTPGVPFTQQERISVSGAKKQEYTQAVEVGGLAKIIVEILVFLQNANGTITMESANTLAEDAFVPVGTPMVLDAVVKRIVVEDHGRYLRWSYGQTGGSAMFMIVNLGR